MESYRKIKVLIVDDSASARKLLTELLSIDKEIEVVGTAVDPYVAREKIKKLKPDVLTLDIEMPKMDGLCFLGNLMRLHPMPVVMISSLTLRGADATMKAMELGAVDFFPKPTAGSNHTLEQYAEEITTKVKTAAQTTVGKTSGGFTVKPDTGESKPARCELFKLNTKDKIIAIGASTGGTEAIKEILTRLRADSPGIVVAQHIPPVFSKSFADRMNKITPLKVSEATHGQTVRPGQVIIAPGNQHLRVIRAGSDYMCHLDSGDLVNLHRPAVDVLFDSVATAAGKNAVGIILTGMGRDGAMGMRRMHDAGATTIAQDEDSSVIWGMPGAAVEEGGVDSIFPLAEIPQRVMHMFRSNVGLGDYNMPSSRVSL